MILCNYFGLRKMKVLSRFCQLENKIMHMWGGKNVSNFNCIFDCVLIISIRVVYLWKRFCNRWKVLNKRNERMNEWTDYSYSEWMLLIWLNLYNLWLSRALYPYLLNEFHLQTNWIQVFEKRIFMNIVQNNVHWACCIKFFKIKCW